MLGRPQSSPGLLSVVLENSVFEGQSQFLREPQVGFQCFPSSEPEDWMLTSSQLASRGSPASVL